MTSTHKNNYCDQDCQSVIDLTESFDLAIPQHLINTVIELDTTTEDSFTINCDAVSHETLFNAISSNRCNKSTGTKKKKSKKSLCIDQSSPGPSETKRKKRISGGLGECPICCDNLGKHPLASTKCGHVYCLKCLEQSLKVAKKCPTCRCVLKGASAYHPLYF